MRNPVAFAAALAVVVSTVALTGQATRPPARPSSAQLRVDALKKGVVADVEDMRVMTQQMTDQVFSFAELGYQEVET
jgi:aminobenzoyl-glutamate utilization protein B